MALSKSGKFRPQRQEVAAIYAARLRDSPSCAIEKRYLRFFDSRWPLIRDEMEQRLIERITHALGKELLHGRIVEVTMQYEPAQTHIARKLLSGTISLVESAL